MARLDWEKAQRRSAATHALTRTPARRRKPTSKAQRSKIAALCKALGRDPTFPDMAYDASVEIDRLQLLADTRARMAKREK